MPVIIAGILQWFTGSALGFLKTAWTSLSGVVQAALSNPYICGALVAVAALVFWHVEEGRVSAATLAGKQNAAAYKLAYETERGAFKTVDGALKDQNAAVARWSATGALRLSASAKVQAQDARGLSAAQAKSAAILASGQGADACARARDTFNAAKRSR